MSKYDPLPAGTNPLDHFRPGVSPSPPDPQDHQAVAATFHPDVALPSEAFVQEYDALVTRNQGGKGSCAVFTGAQIFEHEVRKIGLDLDVSEDDGYAFQLQQMGQLCHPEVGTVPRQVMEMFLKRGILLESQRPYSEDSCRGVTPEENTLAAKNLYMAEYVNCGNLGVLKAALAANYMVMCCMTLYQNFQPDANGVIPAPANGVWGGHAMKAVGYSDTKFGGALRIWNQWGPNWGQRGFFWLPYSIATLPPNLGGMWWDDAWTFHVDPKRKPVTGDEVYTQVWSQQPDGTWSYPEPQRQPVGSGVYVTVKRTRQGAEEVVVPFVRVTP